MAFVALQGRFGRRMADKGQKRRLPDEPSAAAVLDQYPASCSEIRALAPINAALFGLVRNRTAASTRRTCSHRCWIQLGCGGRSSCHWPVRPTKGQATVRW